MNCYIRVRTTEQLKTALALDGRKILLLDGELPARLTDEGIIRSFGGKLPERSAGGRKSVPEYCICLPDVARQSRIHLMERILRSLPDGAGVVVKNLDELGMLQSIGYQGELIGDAFLYAMNSQSIQFYLELFPQMRFIGNEELTFRELKSLQVDPARMILKVYGRQVLMISNQCLSRNYSKCRNREQLFRGKQRDRFIAVSSCSQCYSTIYNGIGTWIADRPEAQGYGHVLYDFTIERPEEMMAILRGEQPSEFIRGHFEKGIE